MSKFNKVIIKTKQQQQFIYKFRLHKGLVPQIATKLVEAGQDEHENIMEKNSR